MFTLLYSTAEFLVAILQCVPIRKVWEPTVAGFCVNGPLAAIIPGAINVATDFVIVLLPIPLIYKLHMQRRWKTQIIGIFLLSGL